MKQGDVVNDRYEIVKHIGGGGMAQVYLAKDRSTETQVALKILNTEHVRKARSVERFRREGRLLCRLNHPNLVHGYELGEFDGRTYIVMEYVDGPSIETLIAKRASLPATEALKILLDIALGLDHLFVTGAVQAHRDLKPANILISSKGAAKITDFGIAKASTEEEAMTMTSSFLGSPNYMSPEQIIDPRRADIRSDVYALGAIFYEMLTGEKAYSGRGTKEILDAHFELDAPQLEGQSAEVELCNEVLSMTLAQDIEARYQTPRALIQAILPVVGQDVMVSLPRFSVHAVRMTALAVSFVLISVSVVGGLFYLRSRIPIAATPEAAARVVTTESAKPSNETTTGKEHVESARPGRIQGAGPTRSGPTVHVGGASGASGDMGRAIQQTQQ